MKLGLCLFFLLPSLALAGPEPKAAPSGKKIADFTLRDIRGGERSLHDFADRKLVVVVFTGTECPVAKLYGPRLAELAKEFEPKGVAFLVVSSNQQDGISALAAFAKTNNLTFPLLKDSGNVLADRFGAQRTPEAFVLDGERVVRYTGRIDDQFGVGYTRPKAERRDLAVALEELLAGKPVSVPVTQAAGCFIGRVRQPAKAGTVTYSRHIASILQNHCVECHHAGEIAPFALTNYGEVSAWTDTISEVVREQRMPPWHADPKFGQFSNDCRLPDKDKQLILDWVEAGAPEGDPKDLPKPVEFARGWRIPKPDLVLEVPVSYQVPAEGEVRYQYFIVETGFTEDKWVKAAEIVPGARAAVHHIIVFVQPPGGGTDRHGGFASQWLTAMAPGSRPLMLLDGRAKRVPAGARLIFQVHYTPNGAPASDRSRIGLVFADPKTVRQEVQTEMSANPKFRIPPGDGNHRVEADLPLEQDTLLVSMMPHTHLRGKAFRYEAVYPGGDREVLLDVPHYDFNWQNSYVLAKPKLLPKGTVMHCVAYFDNSEKNLSNPNPKATVTWGDQTWQEMMIGYFDMAVADQDLLKNPLKAVEPVHKDLPALDPELKKLAQKALKSDADFTAFAAALKKALPKVDRVCVTTFTGDKLRVEHAAYPGDVTPHVAESGFEVSGPMFALAFYGMTGRLVSHDDLKKARGPDLALLSRTLTSSVHVPIVREGRPATLNFWSKEGSAFNEDATNQMRALAAVVAGRK